MILRTRNSLLFVVVVGLVGVPGGANASFDPIGNDGMITNEDLLEVVRVWGTSSGEPEFNAAADPSLDGTIGPDDLFIFALHFQSQAPPQLTPTGTFGPPTSTPTEELPTSTPTPTEEIPTLTPTPTEEIPTPTPTEELPTSTPTPTEEIPSPTPTEGLPTATPTQEGPTMTPTPDTFDMEDYFPLDANSRWRFVGMPEEGGSLEDNFTWTQKGTQDAGGSTVTVIETTTDEGDDDRNGDRDFWSYDAEGNLHYHGYHNGNADEYTLGIIPLTIPVQDIVSSPPLRVGGRGQKIGDVVKSSGTATVQTIPLGPQVVDVDLSVTFKGFEEEVNTPLGDFTDVLHLTISAEVSFMGLSIPLKDSEFWLKKVIGLVKHDQDPDPDDAQVQGISEGQVGGVPIQPDIL